jgi:hypothetical protein
MARLRRMSAGTFGTWRSLVARLLGVQEAVGSNPAVPTFRINSLAAASHQLNRRWVPVLIQNGIFCALVESRDKGVSGSCPTRPLLSECVSRIAPTK